MSKPPRVRFAPSPTGKLHIGGARTALFNWAYARRHGGQFLLRIEDTDPERSTKEFERAILEGLHWLGIQWDEGPDIGGPCGPYRQSEKYPQYREVAQRLLASGHAYHCFCSTERLDQLRAEQEGRKERQVYDRLCAKLDPAESARRVASGEKAVVRFHVPPGETVCIDHIRGDVRFSHDEVDDWVMVRSDGSPTYNFCVVCDDVDMGITHVFRGEEHLVNTPKQVLLYQALGQPMPEFGHLPLMLGTDGKKLSKRTGDTALQDYRDKGYPREAVVNFLCLQGWALDGTSVLFSVDQLVQHFDIKDVQKAGAIFDPEKFRWMAGEYLRKEPLATLAAHCTPFVVEAELATAEQLSENAKWFEEVVKTEQPRINIYSELPARIAYLFQPDDAVETNDAALAAVRKHANAAQTLRDYREWLAPKVAGGIDAAALRDTSKAWAAEKGLKLPAFFQPVRFALSGEVHGADLFDVMALLGAESVLRRLEAAANRLAEA
ncbi:MAG: glutamate--tRNA ligase [Planctomycetaceae bacterium]|nr:glutamate--tRNA ligase [Planctomycetaceae bacterium]